MATDIMFARKMSRGQCRFVLGDQYKSLRSSGGSSSSSGASDAGLAVASGLFAGVLSGVVGAAGVDAMSGCLELMEAKSAGMSGPVSVMLSGELLLTMMGLFSVMS